MNAAWRRKVRREWDAPTDGPLSVTWWATETGLRIAFVEAIFMVLVLLSNDANAPSAVVGDEASMFSLVVLVLVTPKYLAIADIVFAIALLLPLLPWRNEATNRQEQAATRHRGGR